MGVGYGQDDTRFLLRAFCEGGLKELARAGEWGVVAEGGGDDGEVESRDFALGRGQEEMRGAGDAAANHDAIGLEGRYDIAEDAAEVGAEAFKDDAGVGIGGGGGGEVGYFPFLAGAGGVSGFNGAGGDEVFHGSSLVGKVPYFAAGRDARAAGDVVAIDDEGAAHSGAEGEAGGASGSFEAACAYFSEDVGCGVIEEEDAIGREAEAGGESGAEVFFIEIEEFVLHQAHAGCVIEGARYGQRCADDRSARGGLRTEGMEKIGEGFETGDFCDGAGDGVDEGEIGKTAEAGPDVAAANVKGDKELGVYCGQDGSYIGNEPL